MRIVFLIIVVFIASSCTKFGKNVTIKGRVLNPVTGEGIADAEIWLQKTTNGLPGGLKTVKKATSSSDGSFELDKFGLAGYTAICIAGDRYDVGWTQDGGISFTGNLTLSVKKGKVMHADYYAVPYGSLILDIHNVNCQGVNDTMYFRKKWLGFSDFEGLYSTPRTGCYSYTSSSPFQLPMGTYVYEIKIIRSEITTYLYDTIVVPETGIVTMNINY